MHKDFNKYFSSAENLDRDLLNAGIKTDFKFAHNYKLPNNENPETYEKKIHVLERNILEQEIDVIKKLNPELIEINIGRADSDKVDFIRGVCFKFAPNDIDWFINHFKKLSLIDKENENLFFKKIDDLGIYIGYILCPNHKEILMDILKII